jgi:sortase A
MRASKVRETIGILLISAGLATLIAVGYQLFWTNVTSHQVAKAHSQSILDHWATTETEDPDFSKGFALIYIPKLGKDSWEIPIAQGVSDQQLNAGYGHYTETAMPGLEGNFSIAGHRATHGQPLANVDRLEVGDKVYVRTRDTWFTYELDKDKIVMPEELWVIEKDPKKLSKEVESTQLITLTTCNPKYSSTERWIWWGHLVDETPAAEVPKEVSGSGKVSFVVP